MLGRVVRPLMLLTVMLSMVALTTGTAGADTFVVGPCEHHIHFKSASNGKFVSTEIKYTGGNYAMLRARSATVGAWEKFTVCEVTWGPVGGYLSLESEANKKWVVPEVGYKGANWAMMRARATAVGHATLFTCIADPTRPSRFILSADASGANADFATPEFRYHGASYGMLRARSPYRGGPAPQWTFFTANAPGNSCP
jgi:hypothetical protein